jgi:RNA polymerase sigma-70 factor (ECF subfamily)
MKPVTEIKPSPEGAYRCADTTGQEIVQLYRENAAGLFRYGVVLARNREAAQDAVQEAFLRYFIARNAGQEIERPKAWLFQVVRNLLLDSLKASTKRKEVGLEAAWSRADARPDPESEYRLTEMSRRYWGLLSPRELECFRLRAEGLRYQEIAEVMVLRAGTVGALLARVQRKIREDNEGLRRTGVFVERELPHAP